MKKNPVLGSVCVYVPHELRQHADQRPTLPGGEHAAVLGPYLDVGESIGR